MGIPAVNTTSLRAILFDLDGTLRESRPSPNEAMVRFAREFGVPVPQEGEPAAIRWSHAYWAGSPEMFADQAAFGRGTEVFWQNYGARYLNQAGVPWEVAVAYAHELQRAMAEDYTPENYVDPAVRPLLSGLREAGYVVGLITNRTNPCEVELETLGLHSYFDLVVVAGLVDSYKPAPEIFNHALTQAGTPAESALYLGDNYYADVVGARNAGLHPILIDPLGVFPAPGCPVISSVLDLPDLLSNGTWHQNGKE